MSLAIQINLHSQAALDGTSELPTPDGVTVTKTVDAEGIVVLDVADGTNFGLFDPGSLFGSRSGDFVLQSMQISRQAVTAGAGPDNVALVGPTPPNGATTPTFVFHTISSQDSLFQGAQIIPAGYKLSFKETSGSEHVVRLTLWPITRLDQIVGILA